MTKVLTQRGVETAKSKAERYGKPDGLVSGLQLIVQPSGAKTYRLIPRVNGKQINITIGSATVLTLAEARAEAKRQLGLIAKGEDPRAAKQERIRATAETVEIVARRFIERHAKANNRTWKEVQRKLDVNVLPSWGRRPIASITQRDVIALLDSIVDRGAAVEANRILATIRKLFNWACERGTIEMSPCARVKAPTPERSRDRMLADSELCNTWLAADHLGGPFAALVKLLILTGQQRDEVARMTWSEVDLNAQLWTLPKERSKNGRPHDIPLSKPAVAILASLPRIGDTFVLTTGGKAASSNYSANKRRLEACLPADMPAWRLHDLRRTVASGMARLGVSLPVIEKILNHSSGSFGGIVGVYQRHNFSGEKRHALERWGAHVADLVSGRCSRNVVRLETRS